MVDMITKYSYIIHAMSHD